jgi:UDP-N-acetylmuramoyl-tripeptide--D-alanyl-D-alanine ligase
MTALWTAAEAAAATGGVASGDFAATGISIDTRSLEPGDLFVALEAARDGHDFVAQAFDKGAAAALVSRVPEGVTGPCVVVPDVLAGLSGLGAAGRARSRAQVIGVTGSAGKTSTKEMLRVMLAEFGWVHAAEASFNNHWGVPVTLARLPREADFAVIEIGMNRPGEIEPLARLARPHVALVTNVAPAHLEAFGSLEGIAREKAAIFRGLEPGGSAIYNADVETAPILAEAAGQGGIGFGAQGEAVRLVRLRQTPSALVLEADVDGLPVLVRLADAGAHFAMNALACLVVARVLGLDLALSAQALGRWLPPRGRGRSERIRLDPTEEAEFTLIDDAFNANPASVSAALDRLAALIPGPGGRRIAILGDMLELGSDEAGLHRAIADHPAIAGIAQIHCVGPRMAALWEALPSHRRGKAVATAEELGARIHALVRPGDVVLVKGSKASLVSRVVDMLRNLGHGAPDDSAKGAA